MCTAFHLDMTRFTALHKLTGQPEDSLRRVEGRAGEPHRGDPGHQAARESGHRRLQVLLQGCDCGAVLRRDVRRVARAVAPVEAEGFQPRQPHPPVKVAKPGRDDDAR